MSRQRIIVLGFVLALGACTQKPYLAPAPVVFQPEFASSQQWRALATDTAKTVVGALGAMPASDDAHLVPGTNQQRTLLSRPIYFSGLDQSESPFGRAFRDFLTAELVAGGYAVATNPFGAIVVNTKAQVVPFNDAARYRPGTLTTLGLAGYYGVQAQRWVFGPAQGVAVGLPWAIAADAYLALTDTPNAEVIVTTAIVDDAHYVFQKTTIYYTDIENADLYASSYTPAALMVTHTMETAPAPLETVPLMGR